MSFQGHTKDKIIKFWENFVKLSIKNCLVVEGSYFKLRKRKRKIRSLFVESFFEKKLLNFKLSA